MYLDVRSLRSTRWTGSSGDILKNSKATYQQAVTLYPQYHSSEAWSMKRRSEARVKELSGSYNSKFRTLRPSAPLSALHRTFEEFDPHTRLIWNDVESVRTKIQKVTWTYLPKQKSRTVQIRQLVQLNSLYQTHDCNHNRHRLISTRWPDENRNHIVQPHKSLSPILEKPVTSPDKMPRDGKTKFTAWHFHDDNSNVIIPWCACCCLLNYEWGHLHASNGRMVVKDFYRSIKFTREEVQETFHSPIMDWRRPNWQHNTLNDQLTVIRIMLT